MVMNEKKYVEWVADFADMAEAAGWPMRGLLAVHNEAVIASKSEEKALFWAAVRCERARRRYAEGRERAAKIGRVA